jgi:hypothetical protein
MECACICESSFVWFVGVMSTKHVSNYRSIWGTVMMECCKCLGDSRLILLVRIRGFSLPVHRRKGIRSDAIDSSHLCPEKTTQCLTPLGLGLSLLLGLQLSQFYELDTVS